MPSDRSRTERFVVYLEPIQRQLTVYCSHALNRSDEAADMLQSAVANAFRDFDKYATGTNFRASMFRYVTLEVLNRNRAALRMPDELGTHDVPQRVIMNIDSFRLDVLLESLNPTACR